MEVRKLLADFGVKLHVLGTTKDGWPMHPGGRSLPRVPRPQLWGRVAVPVETWKEGKRL